MMTEQEKLADRNELVLLKRIELDANSKLFHANGLSSTEMAELKVAVDLAESAYKAARHLFISSGGNESGLKLR